MLILNKKYYFWLNQLGFDFLNVKNLYYNINIIRNMVNYILSLNENISNFKMDRF
jgi:hypothetical protein